MHAWRLKLKAVGRCIALMRRCSARPAPVWQSRQGCLMALRLAPLRPSPLLLPLLPFVT
jgi:hypothetical protein